jgi:hypothetical protein
VFVWRKGRRGTPKGDVAGNTNRHIGYRQIGVDMKLYYEYRLAWLYVYGVWPSRQIDHINRDRADNRVANLREATPSQNGFNSKRSGGASGLRGVIKRRQKWRAQIQHDGRYRYLGSYATPDEAHDAYCRAARQVFGEFFPQGQQHE